MGVPASLTVGSDKTALLDGNRTRSASWADAHAEAALDRGFVGRVTADLAGPGEDDAGMYFCYGDESGNDNVSPALGDGRNRRGRHETAANAGGVR